MTIQASDKETYVLPIAFRVCLCSSSDSGKSESITIKDGNHRLSEEEIERMVDEADRFFAEDEAHRKRVEQLNSLQNYVYGLRAEMNDRGDLSASDKSMLEEVLRDASVWVEDHGKDASLEVLEEKLAGKALFPLFVVPAANDSPIRNPDQSRTNRKKSI